MVFYHTLDPVLLHLGPFAIRYYGIIYALGLLAAYLTLHATAKRSLVKNLTPERAENLFLIIVIACVGGARLGHVLFYHPVYFLSHPVEILMIWQGGLSFHGALIALFASVLYYCRKHRISAYALGDLLVLPAAFGLFLGRIANLINAELYGTVTSSSFCIDYAQNPHLTSPPEGCRHPSQLYEAAKNLLLFFVLVPLYFSRRFKEGTVFFLFVGLYGLLRFLLNFVREDPRFLGLSMGQYLSLAMLAIAVAWLVRRRKEIFVRHKA